jgi:formylglycine-generating enzyme required for sulfatase activity
MEFVLIPKGTFQMGSPKSERDRNFFEMRFDAEDLHNVEITRPFYLAKYPVTQEQYQTLMKNNPSWFQAGKLFEKGQDTKRFPVEYVSWDEAQAFCKKMRENDKHGRKFRLPSEAEWEYACRAGTKTAYFSGDDERDLGEYAWFVDNAESRTHEVGTRRPNPWGLYDMLGNVYQWCEDYYGPYEGLEKQNPLRSAKHSEERRVQRGGSWASNAGLCRAAYRSHSAPTVRLNALGYRVAFRPD